MALYQTNKCHIIIIIIMRSIDQVFPTTYQL